MYNFLVALGVSSNLDFFKMILGSTKHAWLEN